MTRVGSDEMRHGHVYNGFDYHLQVWVVDGSVQPCAHPASMRHVGAPCCPSFRWAGQRITAVPGAETFSPEVTRRR